MMKSIVLAAGLLASLVISGGCETDRAAPAPTTTTTNAPDRQPVPAGSTSSTLDTDVRSVGAKVKSGIERAGDKLEEGVHKTSEKIKTAAHDVKEDLKK